MEIKELNAEAAAGGESLAAKLCAACGMCCNGVLFYGTRLQPEDSIRSLTALGMKLKRKDGEMQFLQPCPAYKDSCCSIYEKRPQRCRTFVCKQLQALNAGESTEEAALPRSPRQKSSPTVCVTSSPSSVIPARIKPSCVATRLFLHRRSMPHRSLRNGARNSKLR